MSEKQNIVLSEIETEHNKKEVIITRIIYINCFCTDIEHIGRIVLKKYINNKDKTSTFFMWLETNAKAYIKRYNVYDKEGFHKITIPFQFLKFKTLDFIRRIKMALAIIFKDTLYVRLDWEILDNTILKLADAIKKSYIDMNKIY